MFTRNATRGESGSETSESSAADRSLETTWGVKRGGGLHNKGRGLLGREGWRGRESALVDQSGGVTWG